MAYYDNYQNRSKTALRDTMQKNFFASLFRHYSIAPAESDNVLEIGPGEGRFAEFISTYKVNYSGIEQNSAMAEVLNNKGYSVQCAECPPLPYDDSQFDYIFCSHVLEHLPDTKTVFAFISECKRVLKTGGKLILLCPDYMRMGKYYWDCDYTHNYIVTERRFSQLLSDSGMQINMLDTVTEPFVGFIKYPINLFLKIYPYHFLQSISPTQSLSTFFYKIRSTFSQCVLAICENVE